MRLWLKEYWPGLVAVIGVFVILLMDCLPDVTWINTDSDGPHYVFSAQYLFPAHKTSAPLYLLVGHAFMWIPFGTEAWRYGLLSVLSSTVSAWYVYLLAKHYTSNRWASAIASAVFGTSAIVISQSTIIDSYAFVTMFGVMGWYYALKGRWLIASLVFGCGIAVHHIIAIPLVVALVYFKPLRNWKRLLTMGAFLAFYLYIPLTNRPPYMWHQPNSALAGDFLGDNLSTLLMLFGGISVWDLPKRLLDTLALVAVGFGIAFIPMVRGLWSKKWYRNPLAWLVLLPVLYFATDLAPQTWVYLIIAVPFGAVVAAIGLQGAKRAVLIGVTVFTAIFGLYNAQTFDIGRTLDPELSAVQFRTELDKVKDGDILLAKQGWEWAVVYPYNMDNGRDIISICVSTLPGANYRKDNLDANGIKYEVPVTSKVDTSVEIAESIVALNPDKVLWTTLATDPATYGAKIVPATKGVFGQPTSGVTNPVVKWQPSNPYDFYTGAIEVNEWTYILWSNWSMQTVFMLAVISYSPFWIIPRLVKRFHIKKAVKSEISWRSKKN